MKYLILSFFVMLAATVSSFAQDDAITKYFNKYIDDSRFSAVYISPKMFEMVSKIEIKDMEPDVQEVIRSIKGLRVLHTEVNTMQFYQEAMKTINTKEYELLLTAKDNGENVQFMAKSSGDTVQELLMIVGGEKNFAMLSFLGNIDLKKVGKLAKVLDIDNLQYLKKLEEKQ